MSAALDLYSERLIELADGLQKLHERWQPLPWHIALGHALFYEGVKDLGGQCGRSSGKTELICYCNWRYAFENPGSENYIIEPLFNQGREILWASKRLQDFGPSEWIQSVNNTECRITFKNGSFIKIEGSDNEEKVRGIKPRGLISWDELKDIKPRAIDSMDPNRARYNAPALYLGTPPEFHNHYVDIMERLKNDPDSFWCSASSFENHHNSREFLEKKKRLLFASGDPETWYREYEAIFVKGGKRHIIPQAVKYELIPRTKDLFKDANQWTINVINDPAASSTFGVLFVAYHPYSKRSICVAEIYEQELAKLTARQIWGQIFEIEKQLKDEFGFQKFEYVYDEAASWFRNETNEIKECEGRFLTPTNKAQNTIESGISIIRDAFNRGLLEICDTCPKLKWELDRFIKDDKDRIPQVDDHLIDDLRYHFHYVGYDLHEQPIPKEADPDTQRRAYRMDEDFQAEASLTDFEDYSNTMGEF